ncbi:MAG: hypothetical protein LQ337_000817 [Flavoplaca oasis]|nr:MAG: hypothetical protein LQ337_000817 [Flavoplaca oasis]
MTDIIIYAELLLNIRQITVVASLPSAHNNKTIVTLSEDRQSLSVTHDGLNSVVKLPAPVRPGFNPTIAPGSTKALSFRLPIADDVANSLSSRGNTHGVQSPWSAASMEPTTRVACRFCWTLLVKEQVKSWKDLPSENWAEMMDFWHCHKPDTHDDEDLVHKQDGVRKGYGAASILRPTSGVGLVDITSFHLTQWDCNIKVGEDPVMLKVWIFTPIMYFSSTLVPQSPKQVMKLYYKTVHNPEELLAQQSLKIDELQVPTKVFQDLYSDIKSSSQLLPIQARTFQEWAVGLLER